jgi:hypothetical protein
LISVSHTIRLEALQHDPYRTEVFDRDDVHILKIHNL